MPRRRRQAWTFAVLFLAVVVTGVVAFGHWWGWWTIGEPPARAEPVPCPTQTAIAARQVTVNVFNATGRRGLARAVARELQARGFRVATITNDTSGRPVTAVAAIRHGPSGRLAARSVAEQFPKGTVIEADARTTSRVDLVMGTAFVGMRPRPQSAAALAPVPTPSGCVRGTRPPGPTVPASLAPAPSG